MYENTASQTSANVAKRDGRTAVWLGSGLAEFLAVFNVECNSIVRKINIRETTVSARPITCVVPPSPALDTWFLIRKKFSVPCGSHPRLFPYRLLSFASFSRKISPDHLNSSHRCCPDNLDSSRRYCRMEVTNTMAPSAVLGELAGDATTGSQRC